LVATVLLFAIIVSFLWATLANALNRPGPPVPALLREGVSESHVKSYVEQITPIINKGLAVGYRLATGKDPFLTARSPLACTF
jgi:type II secretory pathway component PulC